MLPRRPDRLARTLAESTFVALDFETADYGADSACALGLVRVERLRIVHRESVLIRPPRSRVMFTNIHRLTWPMVQHSPTFAEVWSKLNPHLDGAHFLAAHNSMFDRRVLAGCCSAAGMPMPNLSFLCTVSLSRRTWKVRPNNLKAVCERLAIPLNHHDAGSDAEACARIVIAAAAELRKSIPVVIARTPSLFE